MNGCRHMRWVTAQTACLTHPTLIMLSKCHWVSRGIVGAAWLGRRKHALVDLTSVVFYNDLAGFRTGLRLARFIRHDGSGKHHRAHAVELFVQRTVDLGIF